MTTDRELKASELIPQNWLDPILTGKDAVIGKPPYSGADVEMVLNAIKKRILEWESRPLRPEGGGYAMEEAKVWDGFLSASVQGICHAYGADSKEFIPQGDRSADDWGGVIQELVQEVIVLRRRPEGGVREEIAKKLCDDCAKGEKLYRDTYGNWRHELKKNGRFYRDCRAHQFRVAFDSLLPPQEGEPSHER